MTTTMRQSATPPTAGASSPDATNPEHSASSPAGEPRMIAVDQITVLADHNPRSTDDPEQMARLTESVRQHGLLQPLLVTPAPEGEGYQLVAGHRRLQAAREVGMTQVPALVRAPDQGQLLGWAVIENLQRTDLDPVDEARAFAKALRASPRMTHKRLAAQIGVSAGHVSERLRLLRLPEMVQAEIAAGRIPARLAPIIDQLAKVSAPVAIAAATAVARGHVEPQLLEHQPDRVLAILPAYLEEDEEPPVMVEASSWQSYLVSDLPLPAETAGAITERARAAGMERVRITDADADAAKAWGCLIELRSKSDPHMRRAWITDPAFLADRVSVALDAAEERAAERAREARERTESANAGGGETTDAAVLDPAAERRAEREREKQEARSARLANAELGARLMEAFHAPAITADAARLLALLAIEHHSDSLACRGLRYVREDWQTREVRTLKSGQTREKVEYPGRTESAERLYDWISAATAPEEIVGRTLQALIAARCADDHAVPRSHRVPWEMPGLYSGGPASQIPTLLDALAAPHLPERLARQARERREGDERRRATFPPWPGESDAEADGAAREPEVDADGADERDDHADADTDGESAGSDHDEDRPLD